MDADVNVVGAGLARLVATAEFTDAGRRVLLLSQEPGSWAWICSAPVGDSADR